MRLLLIIFWLGMFMVERADTHNLKRELEYWKQAYKKDQSRAHYCAQFAGSLE